MRVCRDDIDAGVIGFLDRLASTMPTTGHKFLAGLMAASAAHRIDDALSGFADADGMFDTDHIREIMSRAFRASGGNVTFTVGDDSLKWIVRPVDVHITEHDVAVAIDAIENHSRG